MRTMQLVRCSIASVALLSSAPPRAASLMTVSLNPSEMTSKEHSHSHSYLAAGARNSETRATSAPPETVPLSHVESHGSGGSLLPRSDDAASPPPPPTTLFLHGLDSSSHTWRDVMSRLSTPSVAVDLRGCGTSPLGDPSSFRPETVVADLKRAVDDNELLHGSSAKVAALADRGQREGGGPKQRRPFVLVGHSMGGKIATYYAARHPGDVAAVVVEDMDKRRRGVDSNPIALDLKKARGFRREFASRHEAVAALTGVGYPSERVAKWVMEGRVEPLGDDVGKYWSDVNPEFRLLCYRHLCDNDSADRAWRDIAAEGGASVVDCASACHAFPCHLMVAGVGSVCDEDDVRDMQDIMKERLHMHRYPEATHSIHNTAQDEFMATLEKIIREAAFALRTKDEE